MLRLAAPPRLTIHASRGSVFMPLARRNVVIPSALQIWSESHKSIELTDTLSQEHLADLYVTLPTRDGTRNPPFQAPKVGAELGYGHHLVFCHPRNPESQLRPSDGTDAEFCPPEPFVRRMWAGGKFEWNADKPLLVGDKIMAKSIVSKDSIAFKAFDTKSPMIFVNQRVEYRRASDSHAKPSIIEERRHVYLASRADRRLARPVQEIPAKADFQFDYTPSATTLFRFSALTFNGHFIHLDKDYARDVEGYPERLVHGPLTALMLLETAVFHSPSIRLKTFEYRARNPMIVNRPATIYGSWESPESAFLWCTDSDRRVGMTGRIVRC